MKKIHQLLVLYIYLYCKKVIFTHCESSKKCYENIASFKVLLNSLFQKANV